ncbi:hypothetical protein GH810_12715 [Acetobacterium paludosum]|uniref:HTH cro/C1-type domain-containing protein n=1 Tax=Acetobacterium paludosum TaxID=52693 RepID=A0A923KY44_9FIRM|nr:helix-turn-helix transcriptional regulator [Acetobacterium paludosum]MBC3889176.1 hypothetical protein [Acetobacterium paludosum]
MTKFSEEIKSLIDESGETIQSLAKIGNLDRTTLQRIKSGERLPTKEFFGKLCVALRLSSAEKEILLELYEIEKWGAQCVDNRKKIIALIETITELTEQGIQFSKEMSKNETPHSDNNDAVTHTIITNEAAVLRTICNAIDRELFTNDHPHLQMFIRGEKEPVYNHIFQRMIGNKKHLVLEDVIHLPKASEGSTTAHYLTTLKSVISISVLKNVAYQSNYLYYSESGELEHSALFPYYILTSDRTLTLSSDFKRLIVYDNPDIHELYGDDFSSLLETTDSFIIESRNLYEIFGLDQVRVPKQFMNALPAIGVYFTKELIESKANKQLPHYEFLLEAIISTYAQYQKDKSAITTYFSLDYLRGFVFGQCIFFPPDMCHPFTREEGLMFLEKTRDDLVNGVITAYAMSDKLKANYGFFEILQTDDAIRLVLHYDDAEEVIFKAIELKEKSIIELFDDFFKYLPKSDYVLSQAETITQLNDMIEAVKFTQQT